MDTTELLNKIRKNTESYDKLYPQITSPNNVVGTIPVFNLTQAQPLQFDAFTGVSENTAYHTLSSGEKVPIYKNILPETDNADRLAQDQSGLEQAFNGTTKAINNIGTVIAGNTAGFVYGLSDWARTGNFNSVFDNSFTRTLDDHNTKLNYQLPNYYTKQAQESGFWGQLIENPTNTIFNDVFNGLSYTVGTIASEAIWAYATGGASLAVRGGQIGAKLANVGKWGKIALGAEKTAEGVRVYKGFANEALFNMVKTGQLSTTAAKGLATAGNVLNTTRFIATSSGNEAGIEAFHFKKEAMENFQNNFENLNGRQPTSEEIADFQTDVEDAATGVFMSNMAILGVSNLSMIGGMFGIKSPINALQKEVNKKVFGVGVEKTAEGIWKSVAPTKLQAVSRGLYVPIAPVVREGLFEEAGQGVASKAANLWVERKYDPKYIGKTLDIMDVALEAAKEQYLTKQGQKDIWIGGIVGLLGGGVTGEFSRFKKAQNEAENIVAPSLNAQENLATTLTADINARRISTTALQLEAQDRAEMAMSKGDVVTAKLAQYDGIIAGWQLEDNPIVNGDSQALTDKLKMAIDVSEVSQEEKDLFKESLNNLYNSYKEASSFAESIVGGQGRVYGTEHSAQIAKEALTYVMVQGQNSNQLMKDTLDELSTHLSGSLMSAIYQNEELTSLGKDARRQLKNASQRYKYLEKKAESVQQKVREIQATPNEVEGDKQSRLVEMQDQLIKIENDKQSIREQIGKINTEMLQNRKSMSFLSDAVDASRVDVSGEFISVDDLLNLDEKLTELEATYKTMQELNPVSAQSVKSLMDRYNSAKKSLLDYNSSASAIAKGKFKPALANDNPFSNIFKKFKDESKKGDDYTKSFLDELIKIRNQKATDYIEVTQKTDVQKAQMRLDTLNAKGILTEDERIEKAKAEKIISDLTQTEAEITNDDTPTKAEEKIEIQPTDALEILKQRIENTLSKFKADFVGTGDIEERLKNRPDQKDLDRYRELLNDENRDEQEFLDLKEKLSLWKVYDSLVVNDGESVADLLDQVDALEEQVDDLETVTEATPEFDKESDLDTNKSEKVDNFSLTQNTNFAPTIKVKNDGKIIITHLRIPTLLAKFSNVTNIKLNGKKTNEDKLNNLKFGDKIAFEESGLKRVFTIGAGMSIEMAQEDFSAIPNILTTNTATSNITNWTYSVLYETELNGEVAPMQSDFSDTTITGHTSDLKAGDTVELYVDVNHEYNQKLLKESLTDDELAKAVVVHVRKNGQNYQTLKGLGNRVDAKGSKIVEIRNSAMEKLKSGKSGQIGTTVVDRVELGVPIMTLNANGGVTSVPITERGLENVIASGYILDGEITLNKEVKGDIRKTFVSKTSKNNKGKKVPLIIIKQGKQMIAFPIRMNKVSSPKVDEFMNILQNDVLSDAQKVVRINKLLSNNKISPRKFDLVNLEEQDKLQAIEAVLQAVEDFRTADELANKNYDLKNLTEDAQISLDLENLDVYLPSQKLLLNLDNTNLKDLSPVEVVKEVTEQVNQVLSNFEYKTLDKPKEGKLEFDYDGAGTTTFYQKQNNKWYFVDSKGKEQKESEKNQDFLNWVYKVTDFGIKLNGDKRAELKVQHELEKTRKNAEC